MQSPKEQGADRTLNELASPEQAEVEAIPSPQHVAQRNRLYRVLSRIGRAMSRAPDPQGLYEDICRIAVVEGAFMMAWVGLVDREAERVRPVAWHGAEDGYLEDIRVSLRPDVEEGRGPSGTAAREGRYQTCASVARDAHMSPWREEALRRGYRSSGSFPFRSRGSVLGVFTVYSDVPGFFTSEEIELLEDTMVELSFALEKMEAEAGREASQREVIRLNAELEERVKARTAQLEAANRDLEAFACTVSHDLRNPLSIVGAFTQILEQDFSEALGEEGTEYLQVMNESIRTMNALIDGLLGLSRLGRAALHPCSVDLSELASAVAGQIRVADPERSISVDIEPGIVAWGDPTLLRVVMENLLQNAFKFTRGRVNAKVTVSSGVIDGRRTFEVRDNGAGFDMRHADRVFVPFQRLHSCAQFPGHGIGLATVRRIVELHGGTVAIEGAVNQGCRVSFSLGQPA